MLNFINNMPAWLTIIVYIVLAFSIIYVSIKISKVVDNLDKLTNIGGAVIGGIFLAAVTSLPEMFTSISAALIDQPGLVFGNMLGSDTFNIGIMGLVDLIFIRHLFLNNVKHMKKTTGLLVIMYLVILIPLLISIIFKFDFFKVVSINLFDTIHFSIFSIIIVVLYIISIKALAKDKPEEIEDEAEVAEIEKISEVDKKKLVKKEVILFIVLAISLITISIVITKVVDHLSDELTLGKSVAGALFLGVATSLPELTALIALIKLKNYDAAYGDIIGSNVFNFTILTVVDLVYYKQDIFTTHFINGSDSFNVQMLTLFGLLQTGIILFALVRKKSNNKFLYLIPSLIAFLLYIAYLIISLI